MEGVSLFEGDKKMSCRNRLGNAFLLCDIVCLDGLLPKSKKEGV